MKKYLIVTLLFVISFPGRGQKMKTISVKEFTYSKIAERLDLLEHQLLKDKNELNYNFVIESNDGLSENTKSELLKKDILYGVNKTNNVEADIKISHYITDLLVSPPKLDSVKEKIGKKDYSVKELLKYGVEVNGNFYQSDLSYNLKTQIQLGEKFIYNTTETYKSKLTGKTIISKSIVTDTLYPGLDEKTIDKIIGSRLIYNKDPLKVFSEHKDSLISETIKKNSEKVLERIKSTFTNTTYVNPNIRLYTFKKKKTDYDNINLATNLIAEIISNNKKNNISNYSISDKQNIKDQVEILEREITSNFDASNNLIITERYTKEAIVGLYKTLTLCYLILSEYDKIIETDKQIRSLVNTKIYDKYFREVFFAVQNAFGNLKEKNKRQQVIELKSWMKGNRDYQKDPVLQNQYKHLVSRMKDPSNKIFEISDTYQVLKEKNRYSKSLINKSNRDVQLWYGSDSILLHGKYIDSTLRKVDFEGRKYFTPISTRTVYKLGELVYQKKCTYKTVFSETEISNQLSELMINDNENQLIKRYNNSNDLVYEKNAIYVGDTSKNTNLDVIVKTWYSNGDKKDLFRWKEDKSTSTFSKGTVDKWYKNGQLKCSSEYMFEKGSGFALDKDRIGKYEEFHENGQLKLKTNYTWSYSKEGRRAQIDGLYESWYDNGQKEQVGNYKPNLFAGGSPKALLTLQAYNLIGVKGCLDGKLTTWYKNGQKKMELTAYMKEGFEFYIITTGYSRTWHENGVKSSESYYGNHTRDERKTNQPLSVKTWNIEGKIIKE